MVRFHRSCNSVRVSNCPIPRSFVPQIQSCLREIQTYTSLVHNALQDIGKHTWLIDYFSLIFGEFSDDKIKIVTEILENLLFALQKGLPKVTFYCGASFICHYDEARVGEEGERCENIYVDTTNNYRNKFGYIKESAIIPHHKVPNQEKAENGEIVSQEWPEKRKIMLFDGALKNQPSSLDRRMYSEGTSMIIQQDLTETILECLLSCLKEMETNKHAMPYPLTSNIDIQFSQLNHKDRNDRAVVSEWRRAVSETMANRSSSVEADDGGDLDLVAKELQTATLKVSSLSTSLLLARSSISHGATRSVSSYTSFIYLVAYRLLHGVDLSSGLFQPVARAELNGTETGAGAGHLGEMCKTEAKLARDHDGDVIMGGMYIIEAERVEPTTSDLPDMLARTSIDDDNNDGTADGGDTLEQSNAMTDMADIQKKTSSAAAGHKREDNFTSPDTTRDGEGLSCVIM